MPGTRAKDLERRWGLTLVSFAPAGSAERVLRLQRLIRPLVDESLVEFYAAEQLHCTHLTLTRSSARGPVTVAEFVKPGVDPRRLCDIVADETDGLGAITVRLDRMTLSDNGFQLIGECADDESARRRFTLLDNLNRRLPALFHLSRRPWDTDPARHRSVHMRLGFLKRHCDDYETLAAGVARLPIAPVTLSFTDVTLVHHRHRSLRAPHAGAVGFPLNGRAAPSFGDLNLL